MPRLLEKGGVALARREFVATAQRNRGVFGQGHSVAALYLPFLQRVTSGTAKYGNCSKRCSEATGPTLRKGDAGTGGRDTPLYDSFLGIR